MKLLNLKSNNNSLFPFIRFHDGLNVIFARVNDPENLGKDNHNLGKTFLISVVDFCLLAQLKKGHPFHDKPSVFGNFSFTLTMKNSSGLIIYVKRKIKGRNSVCINVSKNEIIDIDKINESDWSFPNLSINAGKEKLNELLQLSKISPYNYRKGLRYFLRGQNDYVEIFQTSNFTIGSHSEWKPYIAKLLGFDDDLLRKKYDIDRQIDDEKKVLSKYKKESKDRSEEFDELRAKIEIDEERVDFLKKQVNKFSFSEIEAEVSKDIIIKLEKEISDLNKKIYRKRYDLAEIIESLSHSQPFQRKHIDEIFQECGTILPDLLTKSYEELIEFNKRITDARHDRLKKLKRKLEDDIAEMQNEKTKKDHKRSELLSVLQTQDTITKYKVFQNEILQMENNIAKAKGELAIANKVLSQKKVLKLLDDKKKSISEKIGDETRKENKVFSDVRKRFSFYVKEMIGVNAVLYVTQNKEGNIEFEVKTLGEKFNQGETFQHRGTTYKKILCAAFDLSLLVQYKSESFYHFVYHDGIFEGLDNRKKSVFLQLVRKIVEENGIQYILSVIDADLPRDPDDKKHLFSEQEIIRELDDSGDNGRLFKMPLF